VVYVSTTGLNEKDRPVLQFVRWVLVHKRDPKTPTGHDTVPDLPASVPVDQLPIPRELNLSRFPDLSWATGGRALWGDYHIGERIDHFDAMTIDETDHTTATRLYQNTARVHFDQHKMVGSRFGRRLMYGGHVISVAHALAFNGLENAVGIAAFNAGAHANPTFGGDTIYAYSEVLDTQPIAGRDDLGALRLRLVAVKDADPSQTPIPLRVGGKYHDSVVLDLDYWTLMPT
jgi:2-methylfumaryl-CoA hydratase